MNGVRFFIAHHVPAVLSQVRDKRLMLVKKEILCAAAARMATRVITPTEKRVFVVLTMAESPPSNKCAPLKQLLGMLQGGGELKSARRRIFDSLSVLLSSRLYCRLRNLTGSAEQGSVRGLYRR